jgi:hypothetical protein
MPYYGAVCVNRIGKEHAIRKFDFLITIEFEVYEKCRQPIKKNIKSAFYEKKL